MCSSDLSTLAHAAGGLVSVDAASAAPIRLAGAALVRDRIGALAPDVLLATEEEADALDGDDRCPGRDERLLALAPLLVVKRGPLGCRVIRRDDRGRTVVLDVPTRRLPVRDTTGAGDAFAAGFLLALILPEVHLRTRGDVEHALADDAAFPVALD